MRDPRAPRGQDQRSLFYARLVNDLRLPFGPLVEHLLVSEDADDHAVELTISVLGTLAEMGYRTAAKTLREYCAEGVHWEVAFSALQLIDDPTLMHGLDEVLLDRVEDDEEIADLVSSESLVTKEWIEKQPRIAAALRNNAVAWEKARSTNSRHSEYTDAQLFSMIRSNTPLADTAIGILGRRGDTRVLAIVEGVPEDRRWPSAAGIASAVSHLGPPALTHARVWVTGPHPLRDVGYRLLTKHGTTEDAPVLLEQFSAQVERRSWPGLIDLAMTMARLQVREAGPALREAWHETPNSFDRVFLLRAIHELAPGEVAPYLTEALWDCERATRAFGAKVAPMDRVVRARMEFLHDDEAEEIEVKKAASERLAELDHEV
ncbi:hypothetical protein [Streptosporangium amethystogenes]|uniref:hypothetical protein n=1 Tax=Streptosporangium amethystogenes TaxID=2002 RepID=UPI0012FAE89D|nr:hypothetical protein [Streptosporangium amethystogenes]